VLKIAISKITKDIVRFAKVLYVGLFANIPSFFLHIRAKCTIFAEK